MMRRILVLTAFLTVTLTPASDWAAGNYDESLKQLAEGVTAETVKARKKRVALVEFTDLKGGKTPIGQFVTDELATQLQVGGEVKVIEREPTQQALNQFHVATLDPAHAKDLDKAAKAIKAELFVLGTYADSPSGVQVTMKLIRPQKGDVIGAVRGSLPKAGQLGELVKAANAPPVAKVDSGPKKPDLPEGLGFHRNELYELVVHSVTIQAKVAKLDLSIENRSARDLKILCLLQDTTLRDKHGVVWPQHVVANREGLCTRGLELNPREKTHVILTFAVPREDETSAVTLQMHEVSPRKDAVFTIDGLVVSGAPQ